MPRTQSWKVLRESLMADLEYYSALLWARKAPRSHSPWLAIVARRACSSSAFVGCILFWPYLFCGWVFSRFFFQNNLDCWMASSAGIVGVFSDSGATTCKISLKILFRTKSDAQHPADLQGELGYLCGIASSFFIPTSTELCFGTQMLKTWNMTTWWKVTNEMM